MGRAHCAQQFLGLGRGDARLCDTIARTCIPERQIVWITGYSETGRKWSFQDLSVTRQPRRVQASTRMFTFDGRIMERNLNIWIG